MSKNILNNKENFSRTTKKMKKLLKEKGLILSLCETADLLAQALGFKNTFDMSKNYFDQMEDKNKLSKLGFTKEQEKSLIELIGKPAGVTMTAAKTIDGMSSNSGVSSWEEYFKNTKLKRLNGEKHFYQQENIGKNNEKESEKFFKINGKSGNGKTLEVRSLIDKLKK